MLTLKVKKDRVGPVIGRHPWLFSQAIVNLQDGIEPGTPVRLESTEGQFLANGFFSSYSQIAVRIWSYEENESIDDKFFEKRVKNAFQIRKEYLLNAKTDSCRLINSENDFLPGLVVDKYADYLVVQLHTRGIEKWKTQIVSALKKIVKPKGIYEKSDANYRATENLEKVKDVLIGKVPDLITITENGLKFLVDVKEGQKTGFFLDQREKRLALMKYVDKKNVLNCFSYTGGFSVYALKGGAKGVVSVDISERAVELAKENVKLNKLNAKKCEFVVADVKKYLQENIENKSFEVIVLDPPAFIKDRHKIFEGTLGYRNINEAGLRMLPENGILVTCSCSAHLPMRDFRFLLSECGSRTRRTMQILETFTHGVDHPSLVPFTETDYLKTLIIKV